MLCLAAQSCPTFCEPMDCNPTGPSVHGDSLGKNTGVSCHSLLQGIFPTQGLNPGLPRCRQNLYCLSQKGSLGLVDNNLLILIHRFSQMYHLNVRFNGGGEYRPQRNSLDSLFSFSVSLKPFQNGQLQILNLFKISQKKKKKEHRRQRESK